MDKSMSDAITLLLGQWHEAERAAFEARFNNLDFDTYDTKTADERKKWVCLDAGGGPHRSGVFMLDKTTLLIYRCKGYGVPHLRKCVGKLGEITGKVLAERRHW